MENENEPKPDVRDSRVVLYMTAEDAAYLTRLANDCGFKGRSEMVVAFLERLIIGGFSGVVFFQLGLQFAKLREKCGAFGREMYFGTRPLPALPVVPVSSKDARKALAEIREELKTQETC
jgi:hypothetical protein